MKRVLLYCGKWLLNFLIVIIIILLILDILFFLNGSLEIYPTQEQDDKVHIATVLIAIVLIIIGLGLVFLRKAYGRYLNNQKYPEEYFDHYIAMIQSEENKNGFIEHAKIYMEIEGLEQFENLAKEILLIQKNEDWGIFVNIAKEYEKEKLDLQKIIELAQTTIEVFNEYKEKNN